MFHRLSVNRLYRFGFLTYKPIKYKRNEESNLFKTRAIQNQKWPPLLYPLLSLHCHFQILHFARFQINSRFLNLLFFQCFLFFMLWFSFFMFCFFQVVSKLQKNSGRGRRVWRRRKLVFKIIFHFFDFF